MSPAEIYQSLSRAVESERPVRLREASKPYQGQITPSSFKITRVVPYGYFYLPVIQGKFHAGRSGSAVDLTMRPHFLIVGLTVVWFVFFGLFFVGLLNAVIGFFGSFSTANSSSPAMWLPLVLPIPLLALVIEYGVVLVVFKLEAAKSKRYFTKLLNVEKVTQVGLAELISLCQRRIHQT
jgi:hypothetical protein